MQTNDNKARLSAASPANAEHPEQQDAQLKGADDLQPPITDTHEMMSDGSASAFEGTEFRDNFDREQEEKLKDEKKKNYPSGLSNY